MTIKRIKVLNAEGVLPRTQFDGVFSDETFFKVLADALNFFGLQCSEVIDSDYTGQIDGELYSIRIENVDADSPEGEQAIKEAEAEKENEVNEVDKTTEDFEIIEGLKVPKSKQIDIEFLDNQEKMEIIELLRDCLIECTGRSADVYKTELDRFAKTHDLRINKIIGQTKINGFKR